MQARFELASMNEFHQYKTQMMLGGGGLAWVGTTNAYNKRLQHVYKRLLAKVISLTSNYTHHTFQYFFPILLLVSDWQGSSMQYWSISLFFIGNSVTWLLVLHASVRRL
jgi:hypothetical protein